MKKTLADPISFRTGERIEWQPPTDLVDLKELRDAEAHLGARLITITRKDFVLCMLALKNMLAIPDDDSMSWDARVKMYWTDLADLPPDLLEESVHRCIKSETFFPKVALIRAKVADEFRLRKAMLARVDWLLKNRDRKPAPKPFVKAPHHVRVREVFDSYMKVDRPADADRNGLELTRLAMAEASAAKKEGRDAGEWATSWLTSRPYPYAQEACPGHVADLANAMICGRCGIHIEELRPDDPPTRELHTVASPMPDPPSVKRVGSLDW